MFKKVIHIATCVVPDLLAYIDISKNLEIVDFSFSSPREEHNGSCYREKKDLRGFSHVMHRLCRQNRRTAQ